MIKFLLRLIGFWSFAVLAVPCDCEVNVISPLTGPLKLETMTLKNYQLEEFSGYSFKNQRRCQESCRKEFHKDMPADRLSALLLTYSQELIDRGNLGFNCTGLTTLKYPVRVKAKLGPLRLGNVVDNIHVVNYEQICFN